ncbi:MAG: EAL domain-containing protein [Betaproteobacteria bacterium]|nr:EAL domain-containing protein [Betaproteobacteria bacterium]
MNKDRRFSPSATQLSEFDEASSDLTGWDDPAERLRAALADDELQLFGQPILSLAGVNEFHLAETLVRLREEEQKLLPPGEFLPAFEHYGLLPDLDRWVVRNVIDCVARGATAMHSLTVNVSGQTLEDAEFLPFVAGELIRRDIDPSRLCFEIDEVDTLTRLEVAAKFAAIARRIGCQVLIDSFGRRSVTFNALTALQASFVKVDGSIVRRILTTPGAANKLSAIVRVARVMKIDVIAECVESDEILARLRSLGVNHAQGFGIALPRPIEVPLAAA